jgi:hypothetical protein
VGDVESWVAVTLSVVPELEARLVEWLLERADDAVVTRYAVHAYGGDAHTLSVGEQVEGRQRRVELRAELSETALQDWLVALARGFAGADVRYVVTPIVRAGHLREHGR